MDDLRSDDEQAEALKRWIREYGRAAIIGVALSLALIFGWRGWLSHSQQERELASNDFDLFYQAFQKEETEPASELAKSTLETTAEPMLDKWSGSAYADFTRLLLAKTYVEAQDFEKAQNVLESVVSDAKDEAVRQLAILRLAKLMVVQEAYDEALALVDKKVGPAYQAAFYSLKGDILLAKGDRLGAKAAYEKALSTEGADKQPFLEMKLNDLR